MDNRWRTIALVSLALTVGTLVGPGVVQAATAGLVRLEGGGSTNLAKVNSSGKLLVDNGSQYLSTGQLQVGTAAPASSVVALIQPGCDVRDRYLVPRGKALIITGATVYLSSTSSQDNPELDLYWGNPASPCDNFIAGGNTNTGQVATVPETFNPGLSVPAGQAVGVRSYSSSGSIQIYGYLVPASAVPPAHAGPTGHHSTGRPTLMPGH